MNIIILYLFNTSWILGVEGVIFNKFYVNTIFFDVHVKLSKFYSESKAIFPNVYNYIIYLILRSLEHAIRYIWSPSIMAKTLIRI